MVIFKVIILESFRPSVDLFVLQLHHVLVRDVQATQLLDLLLLDPLDQSLLVLEVLLHLLVFDLQHLLVLFHSLVLFHDLFLQLQSVLH